jgi:hypothetical protein
MIARNASPVLRHAPLVCALAVACTGHIGDGESSRAGPRAGDASVVAPDGSAPGSSDGAVVGDDSGPVLPFGPLTVPSYVTKVKTILTGLAPTQAEIDAVVANPASLGTYVDAWMALPQYATRMELFFADAFQQSQASALSFRSAIDDGSGSPNDALLLNFRQSFAKTMTALVAAGHPFTEAATTTSFMMTTAMMTYYAYADTSMMTDATATGPGGVHNRYYDADNTWSWKVTAKQKIPLADSGNPASPNYLTFSDPNLASLYVVTGAQTAAIAAHCSAVDPVVMNGATAFARGSNLAIWLYGYLLGYKFWYFDPPQGQPGAMWCEAGNNTPHPAALTDADYSDWRMVTIQPATAGTTEQTRFFDVAGNRAKSTLTLYEPRIGYFTTPAFFAQYPTNQSNQARVTINQTMIVGLGQAFDGSDPITVKSAPGDDPEHAGDPACFACHWSLDPMKRFFRSNYTTSYSTQMDPNETSVKGSFMFGRVVDPGTTMNDLGKQIAQHAKFPLAWTLKLCAWANSGTCEATDPEVVRVAGVFASGNFDWGKLVHELFTSPLVTYASPTQTAQATGAPVAIARQAQLCATLGNRLGLGDVCGMQKLQGSSCSTNCAPRGSIPTIAASLPSDGYMRGAVSGLYVNAPDPFYRSSVEQICALVADQVVDGGDGGASAFSSATPASVTRAIADLAHNLMGLDGSQDAEPISILTAHYQAATAAGSAPTIALKSTFTMACVSPWVVSIGQ